MAILPNVAGLVTTFNVGPLELWRAAAPAKNAFGAYEAATPVASSLDPVSVHTVTGRELEQVPEADRHRETIRLYTTARLYATDDGRAADRVIYDDRTYRVVVAEDFGRQGGVFMAMAVLEDVSTPFPSEVDT